jgi:hypothetical protein
LLAAAGRHCGRRTWARSSLANVQRRGGARHRVRPVSRGTPAWCVPADASADGTPLLAAGRRDDLDLDIDVARSIGIGVFLLVVIVIIVRCDALIFIVYRKLLGNLGPLIDSRDPRLIVAWVFVVAIIIVILRTARRMLGNDEILKFI